MQLQDLQVGMQICKDNDVFVVAEIFNMHIIAYALWKQPVIITEFIKITRKDLTKYCKRVYSHTPVVLCNLRKNLNPDNRRRSVALFQTDCRGIGLKAKTKLSKGHIIPYGGEMSSAITEGCDYNVQITIKPSLSCTVIVNIDGSNDSNLDFGAYANCAGALDAYGVFHAEPSHANATLAYQTSLTSKTALIQHLLKATKQNHKFRVVIELTREVNEGEEILLDSYGPYYWGKK